MEMTNKEFMDNFTKNVNDTPPEFMTKCTNKHIDYIRFRNELEKHEPVYIKGYGDDFGPYYIEDFRVFTDYRYNIPKLRYILKDPETGRSRTCLESELCTEKEHYERLKFFSDRSNSHPGLIWNFHYDIGELERHFDGLMKKAKGGKKMLLREKKIIFSGPCTIILWEDGTKTMARVSDGDKFDPEKGVAICFMKKILGHTETNKVLRRAHDQYNKEKKMLLREICWEASDEINKSIL